ncbi:MAG: hypothetical protein ACLVAW_14365 [Eisenbergiella massiliensis]
MEKRKALLTIALAAVMLVGGCGKAAESTQAAGTKNAEEIRPRGYDQYRKAAG